MFLSGKKLDLFYKLLVKDILLKEDLNYDTKTTRYEHDVIEITSSFNSSNNLYLSYWLQTITKLLISSGLFSWLVYKSWNIGMKDDDVSSVMCNVYGNWYECSGHPQELYLFVMIIAIVLLSGHISLNIFNLVWLNYPNVGVMSSVMER